MFVRMIGIYLKKKRSICIKILQVLLRKEDYSRKIYKGVGVIVMLVHFYCIFKY